MARSRRDTQRVFFANTPTWIPLGILCLAVVGLIAGAMVGLARVEPEQAQVELQELVERHRDGQDVLDELEAGSVVTVETELTRVAFGRERPDDEVGCWVVFLDASALDEVTTDTRIAGPLVLGEDYCEQ